MQLPIGVPGAGQASPAMASINFGLAPVRFI